MQRTLSAVAVAVATLLGSHAAFAADAAPEFRFSGFATFGVVHSDNDEADFIGTRFAPNGAGYTRSTSFTPDTKAGGQMNVSFGDRFSAVVQVVSQHQHDNSFTPQIEWANVKYKVTDDLSVRAGRIALPAYALSESRFVGYSYVWVRPPVDVYSVLPITSNDGVDFSWRASFGDANNVLQGFYGVNETKAPGAEVKTKPAWGFSDTLEVGSLTAHATYINITLDLDIPELAPLYTGIQQFAAGAAQVPLAPFQAAAASALAVYDEYKLEDMKMSAVSLGLTYDPGQWFAAAEYVRFNGKGLIGDSTAWHLTGGYRLGAWTPYVAYATSTGKANTSEGISTEGAPELAEAAAGLNAGLNGSVQSFAFEQKTATVGVRWDVVRNVAIKAQYDRVSAGDGTAGRFANAQPGFDGKANVLSLAVDMVF
jgi:hypothetical protein